MLSTLHLLSIYFDLFDFQNSIITKKRYKKGL